MFVSCEHDDVPVLPLAELASFFGQFHGGAFPPVEAPGVAPVNPGAGDAIEGGYSVTGDMPDRWLLRRRRW